MRQQDWEFKKKKRNYIQWLTPAIQDATWRRRSGRSQFSASPGRKLVRPHLNQSVEPDTVIPTKWEA
jgi:hypothetical protein